MPRPKASRAWNSGRRAPRASAETGHDLVYSRFLLTHLVHPTKVLHTMVSAATRRPADLRAAGLSDVAMLVAQEPFYLKEAQDLFVASMQQWRAATERVVTQEEFDNAYAALRGLAEYPESVFAMPRVWRVWGYKP